MKQYFVIAALFFAGSLCAQEYKVARNSGTLEIREVNHVTIEGHNGNEIIFTSMSPNREQDERAKGLRAISSLGLEDNSGIGLSVVSRGDVVEVQQLKKTEGPKIKILVPHTLNIIYHHSSPYGDAITIKDFRGKVEISTVHNGVNLQNTSGPLTVKTVHGNIDATFGAMPTANTVLESIHGHVDVAVPTDAKVNLTLSSQWGEMLVDPDFRIEPEKSGDLVKYTDKIRSRLNGGGVDMQITSHHDNVYLRKN